MMSSFNTAGAFSGGESDGLKSGIEAAMQVMGQHNNSQSHMPAEATPELVDTAAKDIGQNARTLEDKNRIIKNHYDKLGVASDKTTTQSIAAFEKAVLGKLGG